MSDTFVQLSDLTLAYGKSVAVPSLNLSIRKGELIALLGPSGCGKTTTMRAIAGLLVPDRGRISIDGRDVTRVPANKRGIGLVFQSYALFPHLNAFENVAFGLRLQKLPQAQIDSRTRAGLATVGLAAFEGRKPAEMSGGSNSALRWRGPLSCSRRFCYWMNRCPTWMRACVWKCEPNCSACKKKPA